MTKPSFIQLAFRKDVLTRAIRIALIVGLILGCINHGDKIVTQTMDGVMWVKFVLTFIVPYFVSTWSSVKTMRELDSKKSDT